MPAAPPHPPPPTPECLASTHTATHLSSEPCETKAVVAEAVSHLLQVQEAPKVLAAKPKGALHLGLILTCPGKAQEVHLEAGGITHASTQQAAGKTAGRYAVRSGMLQTNNRN